MVLAALRQHDAERARGDLGVGEEQLVEIAHAVEQQAVRVGGLDLQVLRHHRRDAGGVVGRFRRDAPIIVGTTRIIIGNIARHRRARARNIVGLFRRAGRNARGRLRRGGLGEAEGEGGIDAHRATLANGPARFHPSTAGALPRVDNALAGPVACASDGPRQNGLPSGSRVTYWWRSTLLLRSVLRRSRRPPGRERRLRSPGGLRAAMEGRGRKDLRVGLPTRNGRGIQSERAPSGRVRSTKRRPDEAAAPEPHDRAVKAGIVRRLTGYDLSTERLAFQRDIPDRSWPDGEGDRPVARAGRAHVRLTPAHRRASARHRSAPGYGAPIRAHGLLS